MGSTWDLGVRHVRLGLGENGRKAKKTVINRGKKECDEPHLTLNEKTQPIQWTKRPTGALGDASSLCLGSHTCLST